MKKVLSLLMAFVFCHAQSYALSGGPVFGGTSQINVRGVYAGVLTGPPNALGIFVFAVPDAGAAAGAFRAFVSGSTYEGTIQAIVDPTDGSVEGIVEGGRFVSLFEGSDDFFGDFSVRRQDAKADGFISAEITPATGGLNFGTASTRLEGTAQLAVKELVPTQVVVNENGTTTTTGGGFQDAGTLDFTVDGFKQTDDDSTLGQALNGTGQGG